MGGSGAGAGAAGYEGKRIIVRNQKNPINSHHLLSSSFSSSSFSFLPLFLPTHTHTQTTPYTTAPLYHRPPHQAYSIHEMDNGSGSDGLVYRSSNFSKGRYQGLRASSSGWGNLKSLVYEVQKKHVYLLVLSI